MTTYRIKEPLHGTLCGTYGCHRTATMCVIMKLEDSEDEELKNQCCLCWEGLRSLYIRSGHEIIDITGDITDLARDFPGWRPWRSDEGVLYATNGPTTLDAFLVSGLRAQLEAAEDRELSVG